MYVINKTYFNFLIQYFDKTIFNSLWKYQDFVNLDKCNAFLYALYIWNSKTRFLLMYLIFFKITVLLVLGWSGILFSYPYLYLVPYCSLWNLASHFFMIVDSEKITFVFVIYPIVFQSSVEYCFWFSTSSFRWVSVGVIKDLYCGLEN